MGALAGIAAGDAEGPLWVVSGPPAHSDLDTAVRHKLPLRSSMAAKTRSPAPISATSPRPRISAPPGAKVEEGMVGFVNVKTDYCVRG